MTHHYTLIFAEETPPGRYAVRRKWRDAFNVLKWQFGELRSSSRRPSETLRRLRATWRNDHGGRVTGAGPYTLCTTSGKAVGTVRVERTTRDWDAADAATQERAPGWKPYATTEKCKAREAELRAELDAEPEPEAEPAPTTGRQGYTVRLLVSAHVIADTYEDAERLALAGLRAQTRILITRVEPEVPRG